MDRAPNIGDVVTEVLRILLGNRAWTSGAIAIGSNTAKVKTTVAIEYCIDGQAYSKAITDDLFVHTDLTVQAVATTKWYALSLDKAGNALITQGPAVLTANVTDLTNKTALPKLAATQCMVGALKIVTVGSVFTPATTAHTTITSYFNLSCVPTAGIPTA